MISFPCNASGYPITSVQWYKNGALITSVGWFLKFPCFISPPNQLLVGNSSVMTSAGLHYQFTVLTLSDVSITDTGTYHCEVNQSETSVISNKAKLLVQCKSNRTCIHRVLLGTLTLMKTMTLNSNIYQFKSFNHIGPLLICRHSTGWKRNTRTSFLSFIMTNINLHT